MSVTRAQEEGERHWVGDLDNPYLLLDKVRKWGHTERLVGCSSWY